eukprot:TRINITY_DN6671_c0_g1_i4.p1 TRINITY_DN6671_c0_g1~~TRINITY_DN6671_c0_g1_i4.p1  ORF type:complete len:129 (+),score=11.78 TRINITY_DN6671_c0_g1_i4:218-604(+)
MDAGMLARPPLFSADDLLHKYKSPSTAALRRMYPGCDACKAQPEGNAAAHPVPNTSVPSLFVCGAQDPAIMCNRPYALRTREYVSSEYTYVKVECAHDVLTESDSCPAAEVAKVTAAILDHLQQAPTP